MLGPPAGGVQRRTVTAIAHHIMRGAAYQSRVAALRSSGVSLPARCSTYRPTEEGPR